MTDQTTPRFIVGVQRDWHAIEDTEKARVCEWHAWAACGAIVRAAPKYGAYDPASTPVTYGPCSLCAWIFAARTGTLDAELARLTDPVARAAAEGFIKTESRRDEPDHPALMQLLAAVSDHAPVELLAESCNDGDCEHEDGKCPADLACKACSLQAGSWAGEWEGNYRAECLIPAPCAPLRALAKAASRPDDETEFDDVRPF